MNKIEDDINDIYKTLLIINDMIKLILKGESDDPRVLKGCLDLRDVINLHIKPVNQSDDAAA